MKIIFEVITNTSQVFKKFLREVKMMFGVLKRTL